MVYKVARAVSNEVRSKVRHSYQQASVAITTIIVTYLIFIAFNRTTTTLQWETIVFIQDSVAGVQ